MLIFFCIKIEKENIILIYKEISYCSRCNETIYTKYNVKDFEKSANIDSFFGGNN